MSDLLVKNIPDKLKKLLKRRAVENHRSMSRQVLSILEESLQYKAVPPKFPEPLKVGFRVDDRWINKAKKWGRL